MRQVRRRTKMDSYFSATISCDCNTVVQRSILSCRREWFTPVVACRMSDLWRWMCRWIPLMKLRTVGWWHWNSNGSPWCHPSTPLVLQAVPSDPLLSADSKFRRGMQLDGKTLHVLVICGHGCKCVRRLTSARPDDRQLLAFEFNAEPWWYSHPETMVQLPRDCRGKRIAVVPW